MTLSAQFDGRLADRTRMDSRREKTKQLLCTIAPDTTIRRVADSHRQIVRDCAGDTTGMRSCSTTQRTRRIRLAVAYTSTVVGVGVAAVARPFPGTAKA